MRVAIMGRSLRAQPSGVGRYARNLVESLRAQIAPEDLLVFLTRDHQGLPAGGFTPLLAPAPTPNEYTRALWEQTIVPLEAARRQVDLYHSPNYILPLGLRGPCVVTVHDVIFRSHPHYHRRQSALYLSFFTQWAVRRADRLVAVSATTAGELAHYYPAARAKTVVIHQGIDPLFRRPLRRRELEEFRCARTGGRPYILFVGTLEPRKNLVRLLDAYTRLAQKNEVEEDLVIVGAVGWHQAELEETLARNPARARIHLIGYAPAAELPLWYAAAALFVYPSLCEGFGLPPLEAMACGTPVVTSNRSSLPEAVGDAAVLANPDDADDLAHAMASVLHSPPLAARLAERGRARSVLFDWNHSAEQMAHLYRQVLVA